MPLFKTKEQDGSVVDVIENSDENKHVIFTLNGEEYAGAITQVKEVINAPELTPIPNSPDYIAGIYNLRGTVVVVLDLAKRFSMTIPEDHKYQNILISENEKGSFGVLVDSVTEVSSIDGSKISETPNMIQSKIDENMISGVAVLSGTSEKESAEQERLIVVLNMEKLISPNDQEVDEKAQ